MYILHQKTEFKQAALGLVQPSLEKIQEQRLPNPSGQPVLKTNYPHSDFFFFLIFLSSSPSSIYDYCLLSSSQAPLE